MDLFLTVLNGFEREFNLSVKMLYLLVICSLFVDILVQPNAHARPFQLAKFL